MAVTTLNSVQYGNLLAVPPKVSPATDAGGRHRVSAFDFTQAGAGDPNSKALLVQMPAGRVRVVDIEALASAFGAARLLSFGHEGYLAMDGTPVAASATAFGSGVDVAAAGADRVFANVVISSRTGFVLSAQVTGGTIPDLATLNGVVRYVTD